MMRSFTAGFCALGLTMMAAWPVAAAQSPAGVKADDAAAAAAPSLQLQRFQIPNGPRLVLVHAPLAKRQTTFTFLPITLVNDDADRAQWSHLLEHMLIRTTDAEGLTVEGVTFNGETTHMYLRLETFADRDHWKTALERHAQWLAAREFGAARLTREKGMIAMEEQSTATGGFTTKFALAAWNQIVAHHRLHAAVHGDVQSARVEDVNACAQQRVRLDDSVLIASIGPVPIEQVRAEIERLLAANKPPAADGTAPGVPQPNQAQALTTPASQPADGEIPMIRATWDLPTRHVIFWWPLPDRRPQTLAAATAVARALHLRILSNQQRAQLVRSIQPYPCVMSEGRPFLLVDACLNAGSDPEQIAAALRDVIADLTDPASKSGWQTIVFAGTMASRESPLRVDFGAMAKQMPAQMKDLVEGLWLLGMLNIEYAWGIPAEQAQPMLSALDEQAVTEVLSRLKMPPQSLALEPKAE